MSTQITQAQYNIAKQTIRNQFIKIYILDFDYNILDSVEGNVVDGQITIDATSEIRRTCSVKFAVTNNSFDVQPGGEIFLDKLFQIYIGVTEFQTQEIVWTNMGIYLINSPTYSYDAITHTISFEGVDLMARLTGLRNGYIGGLASDDIVSIPVGSSVKDAITAIITECGFTKYLISDCINYGETEDDAQYVQEVPYDMEFAQGSTWYDVLIGLVNILPYYQIYFDIDGTFIYEPIPMYASDPIMIDDDLWKDNVISEEITVDFENVKNAVEVYGVVHETENYSDSTLTTYSDGVITLTIATESFSITDYVEVGFTLSEALNYDEGFQIAIIDENSEVIGETYSLLNVDGSIVTDLDADTYWVLMYHPDGYWIFEGHLQAQGYYEDDNPDSPFYVDGSLGTILIPLYGDEYDNIQTDDLAYQRAKYEIYKRCRLNDTMTLQTAPIYWGDVNWKVSFTSRDETEAKEYMVQSIELGLGYDGTQSWELSRFYPLYPVI